MKIHLVAIDLDGTLLTSAKEITDTTAAILRAAREEAGVHVVLASARPPRSVEPFYRLLDLDTPTINYNGALVYHPPTGRILMHKPIPAKVAAGIVALARSLFPSVLISGEALDHWFTDRYDAGYATETSLLFRPDMVAPVETWLNQSMTKLLLLGLPDWLRDIDAAIHRQFPHQVVTVQTETTLLQVMHATVSKAQALRVVAGEMGVSREQTMAIGDNANDVGMLQWAGVAVAMGNAAPEAKAVADHITDHHNADGAANAVRRLILEGPPPKKKKKRGN